MRVNAFPMGFFSRKKYSSTFLLIPCLLTIFIHFFHFYFYEIILQVRYLYFYQKKNNITGYQSIEFLWFVAYMYVKTHFRLIYTIAEVI